MPVKKNRRVIIIVLDSLGMGENPDAAAYGDCGANTLGHIAEQVAMSLPNLQNLGLGNIMPICHIPAVAAPRGAYGRMNACTKGKDTTAGHWEMAGILLERPFPVFPQGFPEAVIQPFCRAIGRGILGNRVASGTQIIEELGAEHLRTGKPIVYTSADSVFQIAAHEEVIPLAEQYENCRKAREILQGPYGVGRVIARPFLGQPGNFYRTGNRHDFSLAPPPGGLLDLVSQGGLPVVSIGKIQDIFAGQGIQTAIAAHNNEESVAGLVQAMQEFDSGLLFANLVDFDSRYGHRNDVAGYAAALEAFDQALPRILALLHGEDLLFITSDHGNDPTSPSTDHNRERALLLAHGPKCRPVDLGVRASFADLGATAAHYLGVAMPPVGQSFLDCIFTE